jgi:hypothetical protein
LNNGNPTLDVLGFEFLEGTPDSTRATLEIDAGNMKFKRPTKLLHWLRGPDERIV